MASTEELEEAGPMETEAYVIPGPGQPLELRTVRLPALTENEVEVDMSHCGLSRTDIHMRDNDWGVADFPLVAGHEGFGTVTQVGSKVQHLRVGDTVGIGWMRDACRLCPACCEGMENICETVYQGTFLGKSAGIFGKNPCNEFGGCFARVVRIEAAFAFLIPANLSPEMACPLMCAGGTLYEALCTWVKPGHSVGIGSLGGLGTLGVLMAKKMGARDVVFSHNAAKRQAAMDLGADEFVDTTSGQAMMRARSSIDVFIDTCSANHGVDELLEVCKMNGAVVRVGIPPADQSQLETKWIPLIFSAKKVAGSIVCGTKRTKEMLSLVSSNLDSFCPSAWAASTVMPFSEVNEAMRLLQEQEMHSFRIVLKW